MSQPELTLFWVTLIATRRDGRGDKRTATMPIQAPSWLDAACTDQVLNAEERLVPTKDEDDWVVEIRVYLANRDGAAEGLCVGREDGRHC